MNRRERKTYLETKLRNLKRKHAKLAQYPSLSDEYLEIGKEINLIEEEITRKL